MILEHPNKGKSLVVGVGSALVDILAREEDPFLEKAEAVKGSMKLVEHGHIKKVLGILSDGHKVVPGGSACNTAIGVGKLGGKSRFVGKCGQDDFGDLFVKDLEKNNVDASLIYSSSPTGRVVSIITPDAERSMLTYLGAAAETSPEEVRNGCFKDAAIVHVEGYLVFNHQLITAALEEAKKAGAAVSLDLASFDVVRENHDFLKELVAEFVDVLIANEEEAHAYTGTTDETESVQILAENVQVGALKVGPRGSFISHAGRITRVQPHQQGHAVDTTGAGDLWAAGFLYGLAGGMSLEQSGALGSACGWEVCQVIGADIPDDAWQRIHQLKD